MAWNPSPQVAVARDFGKKFGADRVIIYYALPDGRYGYASYGATKRLCDEAGRVAEETYESIGMQLAKAEIAPIGSPRRVSTLVPLEEESDE
jgi:hypothetical protein